MRRAFAAILLLMLAWPAAQAQEQRKTPYWASIASGEAMMRTGPGRAYPATWLYRRADLPVRVVEVYQTWRKVSDPDGTSGWMLVSLLSERRTALVTGNGPKPMRDKPDPSAKVRFYAMPGVVGRLSDCANGWCELDVKGKHGYISTADIWGVEAGESF